MEQRDEGFSCSKGNVVKFCLRHNVTRQFHAGDSNWVPTRYAAMTFASANEAIQYAREHQLDDVSIFVWVGEPGRDVLVRTDRPPSHQRPTDPQ